MYNYSPISQIYIRNFRNLGDVILDFKDSPIISLVGENEAGKSSVIKSIAVAALNAWSRDQKSFIRTGTDMFGVAIILEDGTTVTRIKKSELNRYEVKYPDGTKWDTNKIDAGLPVQVQEVMGLIEEPETKEFLHIRTYEDQLLFVTTKASENYKVMYDALKVEQITKAIKLGSTEVNQLRASINENEVAIRNNSINLKSVEVIDTSKLIVVKDRLKKQLSQLSLLKKAIQTKRNIDSYNKELGALRAISTFNLSTIDEQKVDKFIRVSNILTNIANMKCEINKFNDVLNIKEINVATLNSVINLKNKADEVKTLNEKLRRLGAVENLKEIDESNVININKAMEIKERLRKLESNAVTKIRDVQDINVTTVANISRALALKNSLKELNESKKQCDEYSDQLTEYLKKCNVAFEVCPKCGEDVLVDIDKIKEAL